MSRIHFLADHPTNDPMEDFSRDSISHSRQGWHYLAQRILNNEFSNELQILQSKLNCNIFEQYEHQLINEYRIEEYERIYKVHILSYLWLPSREATRSIFVRVASILQYSMIYIHMMIVPLLAQSDVEIHLAKTIDRIEQDEYMTLIQKRITIIRPSKSIISTSNTRTSFVDDGSLILMSPKWRQSIDEQHLSHGQISQSLSQQTMPTNSYQDEPLPSIIRKHHQKELLDHNLSRLSLRSISYGVGLGMSQEKLIPPFNYRLPANKIELDIHQQEMIHRTEYEL